VIAVVIPARNEAGRIGNVLSAVAQARLPDEIIVVSDGSDDSTAEIARCVPGVRVVELPRNVGKGGAMAAGVKATSADLIAFVDADLEGLRPEHVDAIIRPVRDGTCEMCVGVFRGGKFLSTSAQRVAPYISGQRAMRRWVFEGVPYIAEMRMGVEVALNTYAKRSKARILRVPLRGVSNTFKERKLGLMKGAAARAKMWAEIGRAVVRLRRRRPRRRFKH
jgi:glycosyltransferase involved in cell wall biosynthesis